MLSPGYGGCCECRRAGRGDLGGELDSAGKSMGAEAPWVRPGG